MLYVLELDNERHQVLQDVDRDRIFPVYVFSRIFSDHSCVSTLCSIVQPQDFQLYLLLRRKPHSLES